MGSRHRRTHRELSLVSDDICDGMLPDRRLSLRVLQTGTGHRRMPRGERAFKYCPNGAPLYGPGCPRETPAGSTRSTAAHSTRMLPEPPHRSRMGRRTGQSACSAMTSATGCCQSDCCEQMSCTTAATVGPSTPDTAREQEMQLLPQTVLDGTAQGTRAATRKYHAERRCGAMRQQQNYPAWAQGIGGRTENSAWSATIAAVGCGPLGCCSSTT